MSSWTVEDLVVLFKYHVCLYTYLFSCPHAFVLWWRILFPFLPPFPFQQGKKVRKNKEPEKKIKKLFPLAFHGWGALLVALDLNTGKSVFLALLFTYAFIRICRVYILLSISFYKQFMIQYISFMYLLQFDAIKWLHSFETQVLLEFSAADFVVKFC